MNCEYIHPKTKKECERKSHKAIDGIYYCYIHYLLEKSKEALGENEM